MPQRKVYIPPLGEVLLVRRRSSKSLRLSVSTTGVVRVSMPYWAPYTAGIHFAASRQDWLLKQLSLHRPSLIRNGARIGKLHKVVFATDKTAKTPIIKIGDRLIFVKSATGLSGQAVQSRLRTACEKALKNETQLLLTPRLKALAAAHSYAYKELRIRKLVSRWGSCSSDRVITLSYYLVQLPWELIDYVIIHELIHTKQPHHGPEFWREFQHIIPDAKQLQRAIHAHKPQVMPH